MRIKNKIAGFALITLAINAHAAFNGISDHSRANCINNETITWDFTQEHKLAVVSFHHPNYKQGNGKHRLEQNWVQTKRAAAVHWGEGNTPSGYYLVQGWHWENINNNAILRATTSVDNCSIYNGWWDF